VTTASATPRGLDDIGPLAQLRAGKLGRRVPQLAIGLFLYGWSLAMLIRARLGLDPWDVLHQGLNRYLPISFGAVTVVVGVVVLLLWIPLRQRPGAGTIANALLVGPAADFGLAVMHTPNGLAGRSAMLVGGVLLNGLAGGLYIGSQFGPGPRDGLMTGIVSRTGWSIRLVRTSIEVAVLGIGWTLGGSVGVGTLVYALAIGHIVQFFLRRLTVRLA
jgi:uncharacterized membrane protein YczE